MAGQTLDPDSERVLLNVVKVRGQPQRRQYRLRSGRLPLHRPRRRRRLRRSAGERPEPATPARQDAAHRRRHAARRRAVRHTGGASAIRSRATRSATSTAPGRSACPEIYALGFRNPWRWSFDRQSGDLWVGDVGQARLGGDRHRRARRQLRLEHPRGRALLRARHRLPDAGPDRPVAEYGHDLGFSITGGHVYRGLQTTQVAGNYVFADFGGMIAWLEPDGAAGFSVEQLAEQGCVPPGAPGALQISSFARGPRRGAVPARLRPRPDPQLVFTGKAPRTPRCIVSAARRGHGDGDSRARVARAWPSPCSVAVTATTRRRCTAHLRARRATEQHDLPRAGARHRTTRRRVPRAFPDLPFTAPVALRAGAGRCVALVRRGAGRPHPRVRRRSAASRRLATSSTSRQGA